MSARPRPARSSTSCIATDAVAVGGGVTEIRTPRLLLRRLRQDDAPALHAILSDAGAMRFWSTAPHASLAQTEAWLDRTIADAAGGRADEFAVERLDDPSGGLVGKAGLWRDNEIGMIFAPATWGTGIAHEAVEATLARADARGLACVVADVDPDNARALRLLGRLGFALTGFAERTLCIDGCWADSMFLTRRFVSRPGDRARGLRGE